MDISDRHGSTELAGERPIRYIDRTHAWYGALGYGNPYRYAHFGDVPFTRLSKPLAESVVALLTTAAPYRPEKGDQSATAAYNAGAKFYEIYSLPTDSDPDLRVSHVGVDRPHLTNDMNCWFPLAALRRAQKNGRVGAIAARFHGVPTNRSQRHTIDVDIPELVARCRADGVDAAILVANCPICHQSISLAARALEEAGIATVVMGAAKDIVEHCGVPRFVFSDFPLGNAAGRPWDTPSQDSTLELALDLLEAAPAARTTIQNPLRWVGSDTWRVDYMNLAALSDAEIAEIRRKNDAVKEEAQGVRDATLVSAAE